MTAGRNIALVPPADQTRVTRTAAIAAATRVAERALLTSMALRPEIVEQVATRVDVSDFVDCDHKAVFVALLELGGASDGPSLRDALRRGGSSLADDEDRLFQIIDEHNVWSACFERHAAAVADHARRRRSIEIGAVLQDNARDMTRPIADTNALAIEALQGGTR